MNKLSMKPGNWRRLLGRLVGASALALLGMTALGASLPKSPVGTWDFVMSGPREGVAVMTFLVDGTFNLNEVVVLRAPSTPGPNNDQRGINGSDPGRSPGITSTNLTTPAHTNLFGWGNNITGSWGFDSRGRVIGFWFETDTVSTNQLSFVGTVVPNKRFSLVASSPAGNVTFSGVPESPQADLSGNWYGIEREGYRSYVDFFTLTRIDPSGNAYTLEGSGPAYLLSGVAIACPQKKLAIATTLTPLASISDTNAPLSLRAVVGPLNLKRFSGSLHGLRGDDGGNEVHLSYSAQHQ